MFDLGGDSSNDGFTPTSLDFTGGGGARGEAVEAALGKRKRDGEEGGESGSFPNSGGLPDDDDASDSRANVVLHLLVSMLLIDSCEMLVPSLRLS